MSLKGWMQSRWWDFLAVPLLYLAENELFMHALYCVGEKVLLYFDSDENILLHTRKNVITFYTNTFKRF